MRKRPIPCVIREMQNETTVRPQHSCEQGQGLELCQHQRLARTWSLRSFRCWWERNTAQPLWKAVWQPLPKLDTRSPRDRASLVTPNELNTHVHMKTCPCVFRAAVLAVTANPWKQPGSPAVGEWTGISTPRGIILHEKEMIHQAMKRHERNLTVCYQAKEGHLQSLHSEWSQFTIFWKRQNRADSRRDSGYQRLG